MRQKNQNKVYSACFTNDVKTLRILVQDGYHTHKHTDLVWLIKEITHFGYLDILKELLTSIKMTLHEKHSVVYYVFNLRPSSMLHVIDSYLACDESIELNQYVMERLRVLLDCVGFFLNQESIPVPCKYIKQCIALCEKILFSLLDKSLHGLSNHCVVEYTEHYLETLKLMIATGVFFKEEAPLKNWSYTYRVYKYYPKYLQERIFTILCVLYRQRRTVVPRDIKLKIIDYYIIAYFAWRFKQ